MESIYQVTLPELEEYLLNHSEKKFRALQIYEWIYQKRVEDFSLMSNLSKELIEQLQKDFFFSPLTVLKKEEDVDVKKYLFELSDSEHIEAVLMMHDYGTSLCVSSQVGCNMGCKFCESGRLKKIRNLTTADMVSQILEIEKDAGVRISHVVVMGIGEPFDNYDQLIHFIEIINHPKALAIGSRHITVSTCGIVPKIIAFADFPYQCNLAISLHAPTDEIRNQIMPINKRYPLEELISTLKKYYEKTNRRLTFEYILLDGINDDEACALSLARLLKGLNCYVNLIPYNETNNLTFKRSSAIQIAKFYDILKKNKIQVTIRREFGHNISAACGQLRRKKEEV